MRTGERGGGDAVGCAKVDDSNPVKDVKNERWRFHMSIKLENTVTRSSRSNSGEGVSRDSMIGVRKC